MRITKRKVYAGLAGVGIILGAGGIAAATGVGPGSGSEAPDAPPTYTSSVQTAPEAAETPESEAAETPETEAAEEAALAALATVTPDEASAAALASQAGTVEEVELSNEGGNVVYEVEVIDAKGAEFEVIIDAGNAGVLASAAD